MRRCVKKGSDKDDLDGGLMTGEVRNALFLLLLAVMTSRLYRCIIY